MDRLMVSKTVVPAKATSTHRRAVPVAWALLALCAGSWTALGQTVFTEYTGTYAPAGMVNPGTVECPDGQPTGLWPSGPPCSPLGSRVRVRGLVLRYNSQTTDPRSTGQVFVVLNGNFVGWTLFGIGSGPMWGTARLEVTQGGIWESTWTGERMVTDVFVESIRSVGHGSGGSLEGLKQEQRAFRSSASPPFPLFNIAGRILQPGGK